MMGRMEVHVVETESPGLYFLGPSWLHTRGSALIGWVKDDAEYLAQGISALRTTGAPERREPERVG